MPNNQDSALSITTINSNSIKNSYLAAKEIENAQIIIDKTDFNLFGRFGDNFDFINERTIMIDTEEYNELINAQAGTTLYELWHNPHITWVLKEEKQWNSMGVKNIDINAEEETLIIEFSSKTNKA